MTCDNGGAMLVIMTVSCDNEQVMTGAMKCIGPVIIDMLYLILIYLL